MSHGIANKKFIELAGSAAEGIMFPGGKLIVAEFIPSSDRQKSVLLKYAKDYKAEYGKPANTFGGHAGDAFNLVTAAVAKVGSNRDKLRDCLEKTHGFVGISGVFDFSKSDHNGLSTNSLALVHITGGAWKLAK
jgi:branched-chain amino acid transport system substrate-binding protein